MTLAVERDVKQQINLNLWCDNKAVVEVFASYKTKDPSLAACIHTIWWYTAIYNIELEIKHISGNQNIYAVILSIWPVFQFANTSAVRFLKNCKWLFPHIDTMIPAFNV